MPLQLYRQQEEGIARFVRSDAPSKPRRLLLGWGTGCGKTAGALSVLERRYGPKRARVLVVCPAIVRRHWLRELERWAPTWAPHAAVLEVGRKRKLSAGQQEERAAAYAKPCQIVSYDLLRFVDAEGWTFIVFDELHHIANPLARQSKLVGKLLEANPSVDVLGLTATPFPTEVQQIWNPLRLLFGEAAWGRPSRTGTVSWDFARRYCHLERNEYGTAIRGSNEATRPELRKRLASCCHFLTRQDLRSDLPALDVNLLELDGQHVVDWVAAKLKEGVCKIVVLTHLRHTAQAIATGVRQLDVSCSYLDGNTSVAERDIRLECIAGTPGPQVLVGTHGSLAEGVRLMWAEEVLVCEWPMSPGRMVQILGRFQSVGADLSPHVSLSTRPELWGKSKTLLDRVQALLEITGPSPTGEKLHELFTEKKLADSEMACLLDEMLSGMKAEAWEDNQPGDAP